VYLQFQGYLQISNLLEHKYFLFLNKFIQKLYINNISVKFVN